MKAKLLLISLLTASSFAVTITGTPSEKALKCNKIEQIYMMSVDYAARTNQIEMAMRQPLSRRDAAMTQVMDYSANLICQSAGVNNGRYGFFPNRDKPSMKINSCTFKQLNAAYATCVRMYNK